MATDESDPVREDTTPSDNSVSSVTVESGSKSILHHQKLLESELAAHQQVKTCEKEDRSDFEPPSEAAHDSMTPHVPIPADDKLPAQDASDISKEDSPCAHRTPVQKLSEIHSGHLSNSSSLTTTETASLTPELPEETSSEVKEAKQQPTPERNKDETTHHEVQNLSGKPHDNENHMNAEQQTFRKQNDKKENQIVKDKECLSIDQTTKRATISSHSSPAKAAISIEVL